jgi:hypothetical protein
MRIVGLSFEKGATAWVLSNKIGPQAILRVLFSVFTGSAITLSYP